MEGGKVISNHHGNNDELHIPVIPEIRKFLACIYVMCVFFFFFFFLFNLEFSVNYYFIWLCFSINLYIL